MSTEISKLTPFLDSAPNICNLISIIRNPLPLPTPTPTPIPDPEQPTETETEEPTNPELVKLELQRFQNTAKADPNVCCAQTGEQLLGTKVANANTLNSIGLTDAGIDPQDCHECCGKAPEAYWWDSLKICPVSKCQSLICIQNVVSENVFFFHSDGSTGLEKPQKVVINGKLYTLKLLGHHSVTNAYGAKRFMIPDGSMQAFYVGGSYL
jgi:hypothetical protein